MTFATLVSRVLDPLWVMTAVTILGAYRMGLRNVALWRMIVIILVVMLLPALILRLRYKRGDWDIKNRSHRPKALTVLLALGILNVMVAWVFGSAQLGKLFMFYELWLVGFFVISLFWKISGHAGGMALATGLIVVWYGWAWWPVLLLVPLMGWARVVSKNHTPSQVIAGSLYSWILTGIATKFLI